MPMRDEPAPSPVTPAVLARARLSFAGLVLHGGWCVWSRSDPDSGGRQVVERARLDGDGPAQVVSPPSLDVRSRVHEYGGGAFAVVADDGLAVVDAFDGAMWWAPDGMRAGADGAWRRVTPPPAPGARVRYGDLCGVAGSQALVAVREEVTGPAPGSSVDSIVLVELGDSPSVTVLASGRSFYGAPRPSPDGRWLAYVCWDDPWMPWDESELHVVALSPPGPAGPATVVAGGSGESVGQPQWVGDVLWFASDRAGFHQPWTWRRGAPARRVCEAEAEFHAPDWALGQRSMAPLGGGAMAVRFRRDGRDRIGVLQPATGRLDELAQPWVTVAALAASDGRVVLLGATSTEGAGVGVVDIGGGEDTGVGVHDIGGGHRWLRPPAAPVLGAEVVSRAEPVTFASEDGADVHMLVYPPGPGGAAPAPLMVLCHGGPTGAAEPGMDLQVQMWTSRGFAVASVDYRGSSGYGRAYRRALDGGWGVVDAADVRAAARHLVAGGIADAGRCVVRGASAGGFTALRAATPDGPFAAVVCAYGVTDLRALVAGTHAFEAHYLDTLVGPLPGAARRYEERSPALHPEQIGASVLLLQGADDAVVPPTQAEALAAALRRRGVRCDHVVFAGEGHGFRRPETVQSAAEAELRFVGDVLGLGDLAGAPAASGPAAGGRQPGWAADRARGTGDGAGPGAAGTATPPHTM